VIHDIHRNDKGVLILETLVALAVLGLIAVAFLGALSTSTKAIIISDEQSTAESLARSQIDFAQSQTYIKFSTPGHGEYQLVIVPQSYALSMTTTPVNAATIQPLPAGQDSGIQLLAVTIQRNARTVLTIQDFKVNR